MWFSMNCCFSINTDSPSDTGSPWTLVFRLVPTGTYWDRMFPSVALIVSYHDRIFLNVFMFLGHSSLQKTLIQGIFLFSKYMPHIVGSSSVVRVFTHWLIHCSRNILMPQLALTVETTMFLIIPAFPAFPISSSVRYGKFWLEILFPYFMKTYTSIFFAHTFVLFLLLYVVDLIARGKNTCRNVPFIIFMFNISFLCKSK